MYTEMFDKTSTQMTQFLNPLLNAQGKVVDHVAKIADFQVEAVKNYSELSFGTLRALTEVKDPQSLQAYVTKQTEVAKSLGERVTADMNELVKINRSFAEDLQKMTQQNVSNATEQAKKATKQATASAASAASESTGSAGGSTASGSGSTSSAKKNA